MPWGVFCLDASSIGKVASACRTAWLVARSDVAGLDIADLDVASLNIADWAIVIVRYVASMHCRLSRRNLDAVYRSRTWSLPFVSTLTTLCAFQLESWLLSWWFGWYLIEVVSGYLKIYIEKIFRRLYLSVLEGPNSNSLLRLHAGMRLRQMFWIPSYPGPHVTFWSGEKAHQAIANQSWKLSNDKSPGYLKQNSWKGKSSHNLIVTWRFGFKTELLKTSNFDVFSPSLNISEMFPLPPCQRDVSNVM